MTASLARLRSIRARWINQRYLASTGQTPQWTCAKTLSGPQRWRDPIGCERRISVTRRVLVAYCWQHQWPRLAAAVDRARDIRTQCWEITGWEPCCCGNPACPDGGRGWPIQCHRPISRLRWVLVGRCGQHGGRRG